MFNKKSNAINEILNVIKSASNGILEPRIVNISEKDDMYEIALGINDLLDQVEALQREISTSIQAAQNSKTYRNIFTEGFRGSFKRNAISMSKGVTGIKDGQKSKVRGILSSELDKLGNGISGINEVRDDLNESIKNLSQTAVDAGQTVQVAQQEVNGIDENSKKIDEISKLTTQNVENFKKVLSEFNINAQNTAQTSKYVENKTFAIIAKILQIAYKTRAYSDVINEQGYGEEVEKLAESLTNWYENENIKDHKLGKNFTKSKEMTALLNNEIKSLLEKSAKGYSEQNLKYFVEEFKKVEKLSEEIFASYNNIFEK